MFFTAYFYACHFRRQLQWNNELWVDIIKFTVVILLFKKTWKKRPFYAVTHAQSALLTAQRRLSPQRGDRCLSRRAKATKLRPVCCVPWENAREHVCARACVQVLILFHIKDHNFTQLMMLQLIPSICATQS